METERCIRDIAMCSFRGEFESAEVAAGVTLAGVALWERIWSRITGIAAASYGGSLQYAWRF